MNTPTISRLCVYLIVCNHWFWIPIFFFIWAIYRLIVNFLTGSFFLSIVEKQVFCFFVEPTNKRGICLQMCDPYRINLPY